MASDDVREIKSRLDIVEIVSEYLPLKKNGQTFWGCCPFHSEKTPSFSVSPERQTFHCFGCGKGGDIFTFIMETEHLEFREALERLAERAGVKLSGRRRDDGRRVSADINRAALDFFMESLGSAGGEAARRYLERRSIPAEVCRRFEIGWAPTSWDLLVRALRNKGYSPEQIAESGLAAQGRDGGYYDRFRGRVIFPIYNITGRLIGFGGRILDGDGAKYLNSPESRVFNKRHNLYLLDKAKSSMSAKGATILVEGYMDAIRAHLFGYTNTVASMGTALTQEQVSLIKRMTGMCYICYDSDSAGQEAALRAMYLLQAEGVAAKRVLWQGGKDPDELLLLPGGAELFENSIKNALPLPLFHARLRREALGEAEKAPAARRDLLEGLASLSVFDVTPYIDELANILGVFPHELQNQIEGYRRQREKSPLRAREGAAGGGNGADAGSCADDLEYMLCSLLWNREELRSKCSADDVALYVSDPAIQAIIFALLGGDEPESLERRWRQMNDDGGMKIIAKGNSLLSREGISGESSAGLMDTIRLKYLKRQIAPLVAKIKQGTISDAEYAEYLKYTRLLKGGNTKA
ncbi:MAG: DNA primase [Synergistaceae bacterium]|nr:DNA primase [Synergistaceae bacterium]